MGVDPKDHEAYGCRGSVAASSTAASGQPVAVEVFVHPIDLSQPVNEHTTHHDQSGISSGDVHESCSSSPDTLWCRCGRSAVNSRNTEPDNHRRTESDPSSTSCGSQTQEGQERQGGETTGTKQGDTSNGHGMTPMEYTCYKQGPNWMRRFLRCPKARGAQRQYFVWLEEEKSTGYQQLPPRNNSQGKRASSAREVPIPSSSSSSDSEASFKSGDSSVQGAPVSSVRQRAEHPAVPAQIRSAIINGHVGEPMPMSR